MRALAIVFAWLAVAVAIAVAIGLLATTTAGTARSVAGIAAVVGFLAVLTVGPLATLAWLHRREASDPQLAATRAQHTLAVAEARLAETTRVAARRLEPGERILALTRGRARTDESERWWIVLEIVSFIASLASSSGGAVNQRDFDCGLVLTDRRLLVIRSFAVWGHRVSSFPLGQVRLLARQTMPAGGALLRLGLGVGDLELTTGALTARSTDALASALGNLAMYPVTPAPPPRRIGWVVVWAVVALLLGASTWDTLGATEQSNLSDIGFQGDVILTGSLFAIGSAGVTALALGLVAAFSLVRVRASDAVIGGVVGAVVGTLGCFAIGIVAGGAQPPTWVVDAAIGPLPVVVGAGTTVVAAVRLSPKRRAPPP